MNYRTCRRCGQSLPLTIEYFYRNGEKNFQYYCKPCQAILKKEWAAKNRDRTNAYQKEQREKWTDEQRENMREYMRQYNIEHNEKLRLQKKTYYQNHKEEFAQYSKNYREEHKELRCKQEKEKRDTDRVYFIKQKARSVIYRSFARRGLHKISLAEEITGLDSNSLCQHLFETFQDVYGYEWDGKEPVHIDHIIPLSTASTEKEVRELCYYKNLRLIKAIDNMKKQDKINYEIGE